MSSADQPLPEGTQTIIDDTDAPSGDRQGGTAGGDARGMFFDRIEELRGQAGDKARDFAQAGKDSVTAALDDVVKMVEDTAAEIDARLGAQYGDYARRAAQGLGGFADAVKDKDVDDLFADARTLIQKSPAVAIGTAAAIGFVIARLARAGLAETTTGRTGEDAPKA